MTLHELAIEIGGKKESRLLLLGARTGMGKSSVAMGMALELAKEGKKINFLSCTEKQAFMSQHLEFINHGPLSEIQKQNIISADPAAFTVADIKNFCANQPDVVFIDTLQDLNMEGGSIEDVQKALKDLAAELACPIVVLSKLTEKIDTRMFHDPRIKDLADTNVDADLYDDVMLFWRKAKYSMKAPKDQCEMIFKNRKEKFGWSDTTNCII